MRIRLGRGALRVKQFCAATMALLVVASTCLAQPAQSSPALDLVPADAQMAIIVPSMVTLSQKISALNNNLALGIPGMTDALGELKQQIGLTTAVRDEGSMVVVLPPVNQAGGNEPAFLMLVPVTKYADFVKSLGGSGEQPITEMRLADGQLVYGKNINGENGYAVIGARKAMVENYKPGGGALLNAAGAVGKRAITSSEISIFLNVELMAPTLGPMLQATMAQAMQEATKANQGDPATVRAVMSMYNDGLNAMLRDTSVAVIGIDLADEGIGFSASSQFKPNSYLSRVFGTGSSASGLLARLPERPYLFAQAINFSNININMLITDVMAKIPEGAAGGPVLALVRENLPLMAKATGMAQAYYVPAGGAPGLGAALLQGVTVIQAPTPREFLQGYQQQITALNGKSIPVGKAGPNAQAMTFNTQYAPNSIQIDGLPVDQYQVNYTLPPELMQQMGPLAMLGGTGTTGFAAATQNYVINTTVTDAQLVKQTIASSNQGNGVGVAGPITLVRQKLPPNAAMEAYVNLGGIASLINQFMAMMGGQPINVPADLPPLAMGLGVENSGVGYRMYLPMDSLKFIKATSLQVMGNMGGGAGARPGPQRQPGQGAPAAPF